MFDLIEDFARCGITHEEPFPEHALGKPRAPSSLASPEPPRHICVNNLHRLPFVAVVADASSSIPEEYNRHMKIQKKRLDKAT